MFSIILKATVDGCSTTPENIQTASSDGQEGSTGNCLATEEQLASAASYFLHTPLPTVPNSSISSASSVTASPTRSASDVNVPSLSKSTSEPNLTPSVPLLLNPELMKGTGIHIVSPQVHVSIG